MFRFVIAAFCAAVVLLPGLCRAQGAPVSLVKTEQGILAATYASLKLFDEKMTGSREILPVFPENVSQHWNPTGVFLFEGKLYVANYQAKNLLIGKLTHDSFVIEKVISHDSMISPENVSVNNEGIAVADYDGSKVLFFEHSGVLRWEKPLLLAHGVEIAYGHVYASSLSPEGLVKLRLQDGSVVSQNTSWGRKGFTYPTSIISLANSGFSSDLVVVDANRGAIVFLDRDLTIEGSFGKNTPYLWLRPYGAALVDNRLLVTDTENGRYVWVTPDFRSELAFDTFQKRQFGAVEEWGKDNQECGYTPFPQLPGFPSKFRFHAGWQGVCAIDNDVAQNAPVVFPVWKAFRHRPVQFYGRVWQGAVDLGGGQRGIVYGSPTQNVYTVVRGNDYVFVELDPKIAVWSAKGAEPVLAEIARKAQVEFAQLDALVQRCGPLSGFMRYGRFEKNDPADLVDVGFVYEVPKMMATKWMNGEALTDAEVDDYLDANVGKVAVSVDDIAVLRRMVNEPYAKFAKKFKACTP